MNGPPSGAPAWLDELHLEPGPPWHSMGTRSLTGAASWLVPQPGDEELLRRKRELLLDRRDDVAASRPWAGSGGGLATAVTEAAALVADARGVALDDGPPLEAAAHVVADDLCVLVHRDGEWHLDAGVVCFPSMWRLRDKIGLPVRAVHGPVPGYGDELESRVDHLLDRLRAGRPVWRRNWFIHDDPELFLPEPGPPREARVPDGLWLRSERQTLVRLRRSPAILFTIRTDQVPLASVADRPDVAARMAVAVASWSPAMVSYRGGAPWLDETGRWLAVAGRGR